MGSHFDVDTLNAGLHFAVEERVDIQTTQLEPRLKVKQEKVTRIGSSSRAVERPSWEWFPAAAVGEQAVAPKDEAKPESMPVGRQAQALELPGPPLGGGSEEMSSQGRHQPAAAEKKKRLRLTGNQRRARKQALKEAEENIEKSPGVQSMAAGAPSQMPHVLKAPEKIMVAAAPDAPAPADVSCSRWQYSDVTSLWDC